MASDLSSAGGRRHTLDRVCAWPFGPPQMDKLLLLLLYVIVIPQELFPAYSLSIGWGALLLIIPLPLLCCAVVGIASCAIAMVVAISLCFVIIAIEWIQGI